MNEKKKYRLVLNPDMKIRFNEEVSNEDLLKADIGIPILVVEGVPDNTAWIIQQKDLDEIIEVVMEAESKAIEKLLHSLLKKEE